MTEEYYGWARFYSGSVLHYFKNYPWDGRDTEAVCGKRGHVRTGISDHLDDIYTHPKIGGRYRRCKKCEAKL